MQTALANGTPNAQIETGKRDKSANRCETEGDVPQQQAQVANQLQEMLGLQQVAGKNANLNLDHLLRATNHLKIAQNEFELAKKQLLSEVGGNGASSDLLQQLTAPTFGRQYSNEAAPSSSAMHTEYMQEQQMRINGLQRQMSHKVESTQKKSFSDQKTPTSGIGHPNSFLYRAHINLNEIQDQPT